MSDEGQHRRDQLWRNVSDLKNGLSALGIQNESRSPIIPIIVGEENAAVEFSRKLFERGIFVPAIRFPTVPKGKARLRVTVTAAHTEERIQRFLKPFRFCQERERQRQSLSGADVPIRDRRILRLAKGQGFNS